MAKKKIFGKMLDLIGLEEMDANDEDTFDDKSWYYYCDKSTPKKKKRIKKTVWFRTMQR